MIQYYKQTQLENMASEKAAAEFQLEKEMKRLQESQVSIWLFSTSQLIIAEAENLPSTLLRLESDMCCFKLAVIKSDRI